MIMKEARTRKGESLEVQALLVLLEVQEKVCSALHTLHIDEIKTIRLILKRQP